jgi:hypothetical protein
LQNLIQNNLHGKFKSLLTCIHRDIHFWSFHYYYDLTTMVNYWPDPRRPGAAAHLLYYRAEWLIPRQFPFALQVEPASFPFFERLPLEIQLQILRYCILERRLPRYVSAQSYYHQKQGVVLDHFSISRHFRAMVIRLYYSEKIIRVERITHLVVCGVGNRFLLPHPAMGPYIRRLNLFITLQNKFESLGELFWWIDPKDGVKKPSEILNLFQPRGMKRFGPRIYIPEKDSGAGVLELHLNDDNTNKPGYSDRFGEYGSKLNRLTRWQKDFCGLEEVGIRVELRECLPERNRIMLEDFPNRVRCFLRASRISISAGAEEQNVFGHHLECDGGCERTIKRVFAEIIGGNIFEDCVAYRGGKGPPYTKIVYPVL